jgi:hypothetical protein
METDQNLVSEHLDAASINQTLQQILQSKEFHGALQLQAFLRFIVEKSICGSDDALKERTIGVSVFGRKPDYETADDPIVRARARQLRKRLELYYESAEANASSVQIVIPKGSYRPIFVFRPHAVHTIAPKQPAAATSTSLLQEGDEEIQERATETLAVRSLLTRHQTATRVGTIFTVLLLVGLAAAFGIAKWNTSKLNLFWQPIFDGKKKVILYSGSTQVYLPSSISSYYCQTSQPGDCDKPAVDGGPRLTSLGDTQPVDILTRVPYRYVRSEVIETNLKVAELLNAHHMRIESRVEPNLPYVDLQGTPVVLLGAYNNNWTIELTQDLPFFLDRDGRIHEHGVQERTWATPPAKDESIVQDYAIVARLLHSKAGGPVVIIAGITACGTQAAADFATSPEQLQKLNDFPRSAFKDKNIEMVVHTSLINCNPTSLNIVASRYW